MTGSPRLAALDSVTPRTFGGLAVEPLNRLFANLDRWRHFPDYQLERRADVFFSLYLPTAIEHLTGVAIAEPVIPELPLRRTPSRRGLDRCCSGCMQSR